MTSSIVLVTGGFDPLHSCHISYFKSAKAIAPLSPLAVGLNSDDWLRRKKGKPFMPMNERISIVRELKMVDAVIEYDDSDNTSNSAIEQLLQIYDKVIFANGGDRHNENVPEYEKFKDDNNVIFRWAVGGLNKLNSSSWILSEWENKK